MKNENIQEHREKIAYNRGRKEAIKEILEIIKKIIQEENGKLNLRKRLDWYSLLYIKN